MDTIKIFIGNETADVSKWTQLLNDKIKGCTIDVVHGNDKLKRNSTYLIYSFTPDNAGVKTIIDVVDDSNRYKSKVIFYFMNEEDKFTKHQLKSLKATGKMVALNGGKWFEKIEDLIDHIDKS